MLKIFRQKNSAMNNFSFVFFGTSQFSVQVLETLAKYNLLPKAVVTFPDKPQGRGLALTPNPVKLWAQSHKIEVVENKNETPEADVYVVASYGKILPATIIYKPKHQTLNVHPSLLPKLRGPSPIQGALISETVTGVTIMHLNEKMDEGPIVAQKEVPFDTWPVTYLEAEYKLAQAGGELLAEVLPRWMAGEIKEIKQDQTQATYTHLIEKADADISRDLPQLALRKIKAYQIWPRARLGELIVTDAHLESGELVLDKVIPPGKKEMRYADYVRGKQR